MQLHSGEQVRWFLPHLQFEQSPLQEHFTSSLHAFETSGIVIHSGIHTVDVVALVHENSAEMEFLAVHASNLTKFQPGTMPAWCAAAERGT